MNAEDVILLIYQIINGFFYRSIQSLAHTEGKLGGGGVKRSPSRNRALSSTNSYLLVNICDFEKIIMSVTLSGKKIPCADTGYNNMPPVYADDC